MRVVNPIQPTSKQFELMYWDLAQCFTESVYASPKRDGVKVRPLQTGREV